MPATPERAAFVAQEFRSRVWENQTVRDLYGKVARDTKDAPFESYFDDPAHAQIMLDERAALLSGHARRFRVIIDDLLLDLDMSQAVPAATLIDDELVADMTVAIVAVESVDFEEERTVLNLWGLIGPEAGGGGGGGGDLGDEILLSGDASDGDDALLLSGDEAGNTLNVTE